MVTNRMAGLSGYFERRSEVPLQDSQRARMHKASLHVTNVRSRLRDDMRVFTNS